MQPRSRRIVAAALAACLAASLLSPAAEAAVNVSRSGDENPMKEVYKAVIYGGLTGLVVGGAIAIADDGNDNDADLLRWGFAGGTFLGLGLGLWWVNHRPPASALLEVNDGAMRVQIPSPAPGPGGEVRLALARVRF